MPKGGFDPLFFEEKSTQEQQELHDEEQSQTEWSHHPQKLRFHGQHWAERRKIE